MDAFEWTKIIFATLLALTVALAIQGLARLLYPVEHLPKSVVEIEGVEEPPMDMAEVQRGWPQQGMERPGDRTRLRAFMDGGIEAVEIPEAVTAEATGGARVAEPEVDLATLLVTADAAKGEGVARQCVSCHTFEEGGRDGIGPNLWNIVGRDIASGPFGYSEALAAEAGAWTYEALDAYLENPARAVPGNRMAFAGIRRDAQRADLLAYLGSLSLNPLPFPQAAPQPVDPAEATPTD